jgi:NTE family protein
LKTNNQTYLPYLTQLFGALTPDQFEQVMSIADVLHFETGDYIFHEGDKENALYIVLTGRLRALHQTEDGVQFLGDIAAGEPVGELALFTREPRMASVVAVRKSDVLRIEEAGYAILVQKSPGFAHTLTQFVISRLRRNAYQKGTSAAPKNIALIKLQEDLDLSTYTDLIIQQFGLMDVEIAVYYHSSLEERDTNTLFDEIENHQGMNILVCDDQHQDWANQCITYCDLVLVVSDFYADSAIYPIETHLNIYVPNILNKKIYLLLLHAEHAPMPNQTRRWFVDRNISLHLHIRQNNQKDIRRLCRTLTNQAVGLVLGGGGAKGFAHIGTAKAMLEDGFEFDFVGGTSAGALFGIGLTVTDFDITKTIDFGRLGAARNPTSNDYHIPYLSLMTGKKMRGFLHELLGDTYLEDIWVTTYVVSTNYSTASINVHYKGLARQLVEASIAIPGVFPPVIIGNHLHVDGGVTDNLPIEAMYQMPVKHVIAISLSTHSPHVVEIKTIPSAWEILVNSFTKRRRFRLPKMSSLLINSLTLNSLQKQATTKTQVALYLEMDLRNFGFLDWSKWQGMIDQGYQQTKDHLETIPVKDQFWNTTSKNIEE